MPLTLEVVGPKAAKMGGITRKVFQAGGTIGRLRDNEWVLPDEYISGHHAEILFANGSYAIKDTSTNGVFINSPQNRLTRGQPYTLRHGDTVYIDDYEVRVSLSAEAAPAPYAASRAPIPEDPFFGDSSGAPNDTDPLKLLGLQDALAVPPGPSAAGLASQSPMSQHYRPPSAPPPPAPVAGRPPANNNLIPDDYDPLGSDEPSIPVRRTTRPMVPPAQAAAAPPKTAFPETPRAPRPAVRPPPPEPPKVAVPLRPTAANPPAINPPVVNPPVVNPLRAAPPSPARSSAPMSQAPPPATPAMDAGGERRAAGTGADLDFATLLAGAGIDSSQVTPELAQQFGQILRVVVAGVMDVLRARERIKDEFRMRMTTFKAADNNPLKFSANVEDALHNLLVKRNAAYLGPIEAFEDAFQDVRNHQMAMLAGVRVAYESMLAEFEPGRLQEEFDRQLKTASFLSAPAKLKYWDLYRNKFHDMVKDADSSFRNLFGDEFAKAYEEQLVRLKTLNRAERR